MPPFTTTPEPNTSQPNMAYAAPAPQEAQVPVRKWGSRPTRDGTIAWLSTAEYAKGALAAIVQVSFTYPIHKVGLPCTLGKGLGGAGWAHKWAVLRIRSRLGNRFTDSASGQPFRPSETRQSYTFFAGSVPTPPSAWKRPARVG